MFDSPFYRPTFVGETAGRVVSLISLLESHSKAVIPNKKMKVFQGSLTPKVIKVAPPPPAVITIEALNSWCRQYIFFEEKCLVEVWKNK